MTQLRQTQTKTYIRQALIQLLQSKDIDSITVSDISKQAGINRGTFYLHYKDKNQMLDCVKNDSLEMLFTILNNSSIYSDPRSLLIKTLETVKEHLELYQLLYDLPNLNFRQFLKDFIYRVLATVSNPKEIVTAQYSIPYPYALEVYLASIEAIISLWITSNAKETPENITDFILKTVTVSQQ